MVTKKLLPHERLGIGYIFYKRQRKSCLDSRYYIQIHLCQQLRKSDPTRESPFCFLTTSRDRFVDVVKQLSGSLKHVEDRFYVTFIILALDYVQIVLIIT